MLTNITEMQDETYDRSNMQEEFKISRSRDSDSNFDYKELCKMPEQPQLLRYNSENGPQQTAIEYNFNGLIQDSVMQREIIQQSHTPMFVVQQITAPHQSQTIQKLQLFDTIPSQPAAAPPDKPNLRSPRSEKKQQKFTLSEESNSSSVSFSESGSQNSFVPCHCTKTHCLKLYCSCFHNNRLCGPKCECNDCLNDQTHPDQRKDAVDFVRSKGVKAHEIDKFDTTQVWGCKCKKTHCLKRYCECYIRGKKCTSHCKCDGCENRRAQPMNKKIKHSCKK